MPPISEGPRETREQSVNKMVCYLHMSREAAVEFLDEADWLERKAMLRILEIAEGLDGEVGSPEL